MNKVAKKLIILQGNSKIGRISMNRTRSPERYNFLDLFE